ncbi:uncharacterized protein LOC112082148 [Eutrema salsugineum]|uniref:uncharacterized protein LOC112082148 n=1 Tax=Eutrema salsugineum TaxID=72664 RepID=UPI000CECF280|nr:uncharacterized protein LOC112082148 [Eutrema salsugineum]
MLVFMDDKERSLRGVMEFLREFEREAGLVINVSKSSLFVAGRFDQSLLQTALELGFPLEQLPIRYMGLPLTTKTFRLPKRCFYTIESMCSAFLWSGSPHDSSKAKVSWNDVCRPKTEGGLGIRRMHDSSRVFALKLVWRLFTSPQSLWFSWTRHYLLCHSLFWEIPEGSRGSWIWRKLLKLRPIAAPFIRHIIGNGESTLFWFDNWLNIGGLIDIIGDAGTRVLEIDRQAMVSAAVQNQTWRIHRCRGEHLQAILSSIRSLPVPSASDGSNMVLLRHDINEYKEHFSSRATWDQIREPRQTVWSNQLVWFSQAIPRHAFIVWLAVRDRLAMGSRMRQWGLVQDSSVLLKGKTNPDWEITICSVACHQRTRSDYILARLALQASIYGIWRERNGRRHQRPPRSALMLTHAIDRDVCNRLKSLATSHEEEDSELLTHWLSMRGPLPR